MATAHSSPSSAPSTPHSSPVLHAQFNLLSASEKPHSPRKRRLTAPPDLQFGETARKLSKRACVIQSHDCQDIHIVDDVDGLIPQFRAMGKETSLYTPHSSAFDTSSVPFVFDDGVLSFYTPSTDSNDTDYNASPPTSSSATSFLGVLPDRPRSSGQAPRFHGLTIWSGGEDRPTNVYARSINRSSTITTLSLHDLDPYHYGPVRTARDQLQCPFTLLDVPLTLNADTPLPINSKVTISAPHEGPVRALTAFYRRGSLVSSHEVQTDEETLPHSGDAFYSAAFPQELTNGICQNVDGLVVMQFVQQNEVVFVLACGFHPGSGDVEVGHISPHKKPLQEGSPSSSSLSEQYWASDTGVPSNRARPPTRPIPKLSVSIPNMLSRKGHIQLCTDSPGLTPDSSIRPTPVTGIPHNVLPVTPFEQLIRTPANPPEILRNTTERSTRSGFLQTPAEEAYPFTLSSTSPSGTQSPAFGVLDSTGPAGSAPAWLTRSRLVTPFTPSFFFQQPHTAAASNAMNSMTLRALDAGTPTLCKSDYLDPPLASPHSIGNELMPSESGRPSSTSVS